MFDNRFYLNSTALQQYYSGVNLMLNYIKKMAQKPLHKEFGLSKLQYKEFERNLRSSTPCVEFYDILCDVYLHYLNNSLHERYNNAFDEMFAPDIITE